MRSFWFRVQALGSGLLRRLGFRVDLGLRALGFRAFFEFRTARFRASPNRTRRDDRAIGILWGPAA